MSQVQFQSPSNPLSGSIPMAMAAPPPPQPGFSIPCAAAPTLPSESASHPLRSSALPSASVTPYNNSTGGSAALVDTPSNGLEEGLLRKKGGCTMFALHLLFCMS